MGRKIEFPKIDKSIQKVVDRINDMEEKEEHEVLLPLNVVAVNELRKDIERNNKKSEKSSKRTYILSVIIFIVSILSLSFSFYKEYYSKKNNNQQLETIESKTLYLEEKINSKLQELLDKKDEKGVEKDSLN